MHRLAKAASTADTKTDDYAAGGADAHVHSGQRDAPGHQDTLDRDIQVPVGRVEAADVGSVSLQPVGIT